MTRRAAISLVVFFFLLALPKPLRAVSIAEVMLSRTNWGDCFDFRIEGICVSGLSVGIEVSYRLPHLLLDVVKTPGDSNISEVGLITGGLGLDMLGGGGSLANTGEWNLHYNETHTLENPLQWIIAPVELLCGTPSFGSSLGAYYLSELDPVMWRLELAGTVAEPKTTAAASACTAISLIDSDNPLCLGVWGPLYPRNGFAIHSSPSTASGITGFRGVDIAADPEMHIVVEKLGFNPNRGDDRMQMADPAVSDCLKVGTNPLEWDHGKGALSGKYLWLYWHRVSCCLL